MNDTRSHKYSSRFWTAAVLVSVKYTVIYADNNARNEKRKEVKK